MENVRIKLSIDENILKNQGIPANIIEEIISLSKSSQKVLLDVTLTGKSREYFICVIDNFCEYYKINNIEFINLNIPAKTYMQDTLFFKRNNNLKSLDRWLKFLNFLELNFNSLPYYYDKNKFIEKYNYFRDVVLFKDEIETH